MHDANVFIISAVQSTPSIMTEPEGSCVTAGSTVSLSVVASGRFLSYEWFEGSVGLIDDDVITGADTNTLTISDVAVNATYHVEVSNVAGRVSSLQVNVTVGNIGE